MSLGLSPLGTRPLGLGPAATPATTPANSGAADWAETGETVLLGATATVRAACAWADAGETVAATGQLQLTCAVAWTEASETPALLATSAAHGPLSWAEASEIHSGAIAVGDVAAVAGAWSEGSETVVSSVHVSLSALCGWTEASELQLLAATVRVGAGAGWPEAGEMTLAALDVQAQQAAALGWFESNEVIAIMLGSLAPSYSRAPAGPGYSPQTVEVQARPAQTGGYRPPVIQRNIR